MLDADANLLRLGTEAERLGSGYFCLALTVAAFGINSQELLATIVSLSQFSFSNSFHISLRRVIHIDLN